MAAITAAVLTFASVLSSSAHQSLTVTVSGVANEQT
jgi:hypothetical protein